MALPVDVTDRNRVEQLFTEIVSAWGRVDILVICAGITADSHTAEESDPGAWEDVISVNLLEAYHCARAAVPHMKRRGGKILTVGSGLGHK